MSDDASRPDGPETESLSGQIDEICDRFEADWNSGRQPRIEDYLGGVPEAGRGRLLRELLVVELDLRHRDHQQPTAEEYRRRFPDDHEQIDAAFAILTAPHVAETLDQARPRSKPQPQALHIRCPHCRNPIEIVDDTPMEEIVCPSCGSSFNLAGDEALAYETVGGTTRRRRAFGHFELIEQLGVGAFGAVWRARDTQLDRTVALKIPRKGQLTREETEKMLREARAAAQLRHPSIVSVHEVGLEDGVIYTVSDFIEGVSLHDWLSGHRPTSREAAELCAKLADAVHFAHQHGVIHRDLKPLNVVLDPSGEPHVMDFGLAKREAGEITMTIDGEILGTPAYMPPEQAGGEAHRADRRSDVYSLGVIFFELLTGERPFRGNPRMLIHQVLHDDAPSPRKLDGHIPRDLETICLKCLEKDPNRRYQSAETLSDELRRFLRGEPIHARPVSHVERLWRWCRRNPVVSILSAVLLLSTLVGVVGSVGTFAFFWVRAERDNAIAARIDAEEAQGNERDARIAAEDARKEEQYARIKEREARVAAEDAQKKEEQARKEQEYAAYITRIALAAANIEENAFDRARTLLQECPKGLRHWEWGRLTYLCTQADLDVNAGQPVEAVAFAPDGSRFATAGWGGMVYLWNAKDGKQLGPPINTGAGYVFALAFSPDGNQLAIGTNDRPNYLKIWDFEAQQLRQLPGHTDAVVSVAYSAKDPTKLVTSSYDGSAMLWDPTTREVLQPPLRGHEGTVWSAAFDPDEKRILTAGEDGYVVVWSCQTDEADAQFKAGARFRGHTGPVYAVAFSADGQYVASAGHDKRVLLWEPGKSESFHIAKLVVAEQNPPHEYRALQGHTAAVRSVQFSLDGRWLVSGGNDNTVRVWEAGTGKLLKTLRGHGGWVLSCVFSPHSSPDDPRIVSGSHDGHAKTWDFQAYEEQRILSSQDDAVPGASFSPNGQGSLSANGDNPARIWSAETRILEKRLRAGHEDFVNSAVFSLDGSMVVTASRDKTAKLWKYNSANEEWEVDKVFRGHTASVHTAVFSPDGKWVLTASEDKTARIWDVATGKELPFSPLKKQDQDVFSHEQAVLCAAYSRDGKWIITGSEDNTARLWDATTGRPVKITGPTPGEQRDLILAGHSAGVTSVALSEDRKRAITGSRDLMARLWELEQGETLVTLKGHTEEVTCVTFSPDGKSILTAGRDKRLILWPAVDWRTPFGESGSLSGQTLGRIFGGTGAGNGRWAPVRVASDEGPIDLLKCLDLKSDAVQGKWQLEQGLLVSPKTYGARIQMPVVPPDEFKVTLVAERKEGENGLIMGLMAGGNQFIATLDFQEPGKGPVSALEDVDGKRVTLNDTTFYGKALAESGPSTIVYTVRKDHITVECNGKTVIDFKGDPSRLSLNKYWKVPNQECLFLGTYDCTYVIHKLELTPLSGKEGQPPETTPPTTPEGPLAEPPSEKPGEATPAPSGELLPAIPNDTPASGAPASPPREIKPTASEKRDSDAKL